MRGVRNLVLVLIAMSIIDAAQIPAFTAFPAPELFKGPAEKPVLRGPRQKQFESQIRQQAQPPSNFAGHYKIAEWGCGSACVSIAIIDLKTGEVYDGPFSTLGYGIPYRYEGGSAELEYKPQSRLLIVRGCPEDKNCATYYYEWNSNRFRQLRAEPHGPLM